MADAATTIMNELAKLLGEARSYDELYAKALPLFQRTKAKKQTQGKRREDPAIGGKDGIRAWAMKTIHGENKAEKAQIEKARVLYYAYKEAHGLKHTVNPKSGFNWERQKAGLKPVSWSGDKGGSAGAAAPAGAGAAGGAEPGGGGAAAGPAAGSAKNRTQAQKDLAQARRVSAMTPEELQRWAAGQKDIGKISREQAATKIKQARRIVERASATVRRDRPGGNAQPASPEGPPPTAAQVAERQTRRQQTVLSAAAQKQMQQDLGWQLPGWLAKNPRVKNDLEMGTITPGEALAQMAAAIGYATPTAVTPQAQPRPQAPRPSGAASLAAASEQASELARTGRKLETGLRAPSLFGHNEAGQSYLQWLRSTATRPMRASNPASWNPTEGARTEAKVAQQKKRRKNAFKDRNPTKNPGGGR